MGSSACMSALPARITRALGPERRPKVRDQRTDGHPSVLCAVRSPLHTGMQHTILSLSARRRRQYTASHLLKVPHIPASERDDAAFVAAVVVLLPAGAGPPPLPQSSCCRPPCLGIPLSHGNNSRNSSCSFGANLLLS